MLSRLRRRLRRSSPVAAVGAAAGIAWLDVGPAGAGDLAATVDALVTTHIPLPEIALRLALALLFSISIGYEREASRKPAGLRTHMMVSLAACAFTILALEMMAATQNGQEEIVRSDPIRVIEAIVAGVAFLGAGTIIQARSSIVGITTGASIWLVGAIGLACGGGYYAIALLLVLFSLFVLVAVGAFEVHVMKQKDKTLKQPPPRKDED